MDDERIEGRVARVLNEREVAINRGSDHGVEAGMRFAILNRLGANITDPETGEPLGSVEIEKAVVKIVRVYPNLSVGRTFRKYQVGVSLFQDMMSTRSEIETLRTTEATYQEELSEDESYIKVGDPVVQVAGIEFDTES